MYSFCSTLLLALLLLRIVDVQTYLMFPLRRSMSHSIIILPFHPIQPVCSTYVVYKTDTAFLLLTSYLLSISNRFVTFSTVLFFALPTDTYFPPHCLYSYFPSVPHPYFPFAFPTSLHFLRLVYNPNFPPLSLHPYFPSVLPTSLLSSAMPSSILSLRLTCIPTVPPPCLHPFFPPHCLYPYFPSSLLTSLLSLRLAYIPTFPPPCLHPYFPPHCLYPYFPSSLLTSLLSLRLAYIPTFPPPCLHPYFPSALPIFTFPPPCLHPYFLTISPKSLLFSPFSATSLLNFQACHPPYSKCG
jgi:hypothetical protein